MGNKHGTDQTATVKWIANQEERAFKEAGLGLRDNYSDWTQGTECFWMTSEAKGFSPMCSEQVESLVMTILNLVVGTPYDICRRLFPAKWFPCPRSNAHSSPRPAVLYSASYSPGEFFSSEKAVRMILSASPGSHHHAL